MQQYVEKPDLLRTIEWQIMHPTNSTTPFVKVSQNTPQCKLILMHLQTFEHSIQNSCMKNSLLFF